MKLEENFTRDLDLLKQKGLLSEQTSFQVSQRLEKLENLRTSLARLNYKISTSLHDPLLKTEYKTKGALNTDLEEKRTINDNKKENLVWINTVLTPLREIDPNLVDRVCGHINKKFN